MYTYCDLLLFFKENILIDKKCQSSSDYLNAEENKFHNVQV